MICHHALGMPWDTSPEGGSGHHWPDTGGRSIQKQEERLVSGTSPLADRTALAPDMAKSILTGDRPWNNTPDTWFYADSEASFEKHGHFVDTKHVESQHHLAMFRVERLALLNLKFPPPHSIFPFPWIAPASIFSFLEGGKGGLLHSSGSQSWPCVKSLGDVS